MEYRNDMGRERKKIVRVMYNPDERPLFKIGKHNFKVADISEMRLRFFNDKKINFKHWVNGTITLLCGESVDIKGMIVKERENAIDLNIKNPINQRMLLKELQYMTDSRPIPE